MKTDYVDFNFVHAIGESSKSLEKEKKRLLDDEMLSAVDELKKAGKIEVSRRVISRSPITWRPFSSRQFSPDILT